MLQKFQKRGPFHQSNLHKYIDTSSKATKYIIIGDVIFLVGSTFFFGKMHLSRDFREKVNNNFPFFLKAYYELDRLVLKKNMKVTDYEAWGLPLEQEDTKK